MEFTKKRNIETRENNEQGYWIKQLKYGFW